MIDFVENARLDANSALGHRLLGDHEYASRRWAPALRSYTRHVAALTDAFRDFDRMYSHQEFSGSVRSSTDSAVHISVYFSLLRVLTMSDIRSSSPTCSTARRAWATPLKRC